MVLELVSEATFNEAVAKAKLSVIDFYADWCAPCKMMAPVLEKLEHELKDAQVDFYKVNVDKQTAVSRNNGVSAMPTFILFVDGKEAHRVVGAAPDKLKKAVHKYLKV